MKDEEKTKKQLTSELAELRRTIAELKKLQIEHNGMEEALRERERFFFGTLNDKITFAAVLDFSGKVIFVNNIALSVSGVKQEDVIGKMFYDTCWWEYSEKARQTIKEDIETCASGKILIREIEAQMTGRRLMWIEFSMYPVYDKDRRIKYLVHEGRDITKRKQAEQRLAYTATHDLLTDLPNRLLFNDRLTLALAYAKRNRKKLAVMLLDLDLFKEVNDTLGHSVGDKLLRVVSDRLRGLLRKSDTVARMGGDEFLILLPEITEVEDTGKIAQNILNSIQEPFLVDDHELHITTSIGFAIYPNDGKDGDTLIKNADVAMYCSKERGRANYRRYTPRPLTQKS